MQRTVLPSTRAETITRSKVGGMRHQSAACFARLNPGSTAITISQDGFISIFATAARNPGPDQPGRPVVMLTGIERYYETEWSLRVR